MAKTKRASRQPVYQLKVSLLKIHPPIWRRILVPGNTKLPDLHLVLQAVMGWTNSHLHKFTINGIEYSIPDPDFEDDLEDEKRIRLDGVFTPYDPARKAPAAECTSWSGFCHGLRNAGPLYRAGSQPQNPLSDL